MQHAYLTRDNIKGANDYALEEVDVPEWGGIVTMRSMSAINRDHMQIWFMEVSGFEQEDGKRSESNPEAYRGMQTTIVSYCLCDQKGELLFNDQEGRDILNSKSGTVIDQLNDVAMRINKMDGEAPEQEKKA